MTVSARGMNSMATNPSPGDAGDAEVVRALVRRALRCAIAAELDGRADADIGRALREACDRARKDNLRAEQLLLVLKETWRALPETRRLRLDGDLMLARIVSACIGEYYRIEARGDSQRGSR